MEKLEMYKEKLAQCRMMVRVCLDKERYKDAEDLCAKCDVLKRYIEKLEKQLA